MTKPRKDNIGVGQDFDTSINYFVMICGLAL